ncbi:MAG: response regulator [Smithellaceae bacterium]|nr:response regulator [Smithellaceae bacterium]
MGYILVVDDEIEVCKACKEFLSLKGHEVETALDGTTAISKAKEIRPQLVLLDIVLPGMWGIDVLKAIKKIDPMINVIMVTAIGDERMAKDSLKLGALDYMTKPLDLNKLYDDIIAKLLIPKKKSPRRKTD